MSIILAWVRASVKIENMKSTSTAYTREGCGQPLTTKCTIAGGVFLIIILLHSAGAYGLIK